jgi:hypothetical protein
MPQSRQATAPQARRATSGTTTEVRFSVASVSGIESAPQLFKLPRHNVVVGGPDLHRGFPV